MIPITSSSELESNNGQLGEIAFLDFRTLDIVAAHRRLGQEVQRQARKMLLAKLHTLSQEQLVQQVQLAKRCKLALHDRISTLTIDGKIRNAIREYLSCIAAWSEGIQLHRFQHPQIRHLRRLGTSVSGDELALLLQNDEVGCQTGVRRNEDGSAILWHTEEDVEEPGSRFDHLRIAAFRVEMQCGFEDVYTFIYPDLLPGPAYSWRSDNFVQAIDSLYLKQDIENGSMFANIAGWLMLRLGKAVEPIDVIKALFPYVDGYALIVVREKAGKVLAEKLEFAGDQILRETLGFESGDFLFQVNVFSDRDSELAKTHEDIDQDERRYYQERQRRTERMLKKNGVFTGGNELSCAFRLLSSRLGDDYAYANSSVKSWFIAQISSVETRVRFGPGAAMKDKTDPSFDSGFSRADSLHG
jgi:hypothetical protein